MLAAMVEDSGRAWFLKVVGPVDQVGQMAAEFESLVRSLQLADDPSEMKWTLPPGWKEGSGSAMRYATLRAGELEVSVTKLPWRDASWEEYVLSNVNRWRDQVQLPPTTAEDLTDSTRRLKLNGRRVVIVDLTGQASSTNSPPLTQIQPPRRFGCAAATTG